MTDALTVYAIRNEAGEWMRSVGYGGGSRHWVAEVCNAKLYTKLGQARGRVTFWANHAPGKKPPVIVAFSMALTDARVIEETDRVAAAKMRKATAQAESAKRKAKRQLHAAEETIKRAEAEIQKIRGVEKRTP